MKILQVTNFFKPSWESGGPARVAYEISKKLVERGHEVTVYTTDGFKHRLDVEKNKPVDVDGIRTYYFRNLSSYLAGKSSLPIPYYLPVVAMKDIKGFDIVHIHEHRTVLAAVACHYAKKHNISYVVQAHGSILPTFQKQTFKKIFDMFVGYRILSGASKVIALTKTESEQYKKMGIDENKIVIVPNGIDMSEYDNLPERGHFKEKYSIKDDEKVILYLGRVHRIKGVDLLIKAFADLAKGIDDVRLVIVGPDDGLLPALKKQIEYLKIGDRILFTGPLYERNKLEAYVDADVYVLPSVYEIFSVTVLEACACGTPVVVTDRCGIADVIDGEAGFATPYNKDQLRDKIVEILGDEELRLRFGEGGRKLTRKYFSWDTILGRIEGLYMGCIKGAEKCENR